MIALYGDTSIPLQVCRSAAGYYIGRLIQDGDMAGAPYARDSVEYFPTEEAAKNALATGLFTMRNHP